MRIILNIIRKEFIQIFRNKIMLPFIFIAPVLQLVILVFAANLEMKEIKMFVVDKDLSSTSRRLIYEFTASPFYKFTGSGFNLEEAEDLMISDKVDLIIHIPAGFERDLRTTEISTLQFIVSAVNATKASLINGYNKGIIKSFNKEIRYELSGGAGGSYRQINIIPDFWYNPELNYKIFILPGILVILVTIIGMFLAALNLVREKEIGTSEQINVTPIRKFHYITGKLFPFWVIALVELGFGLTIGKFFFHLPILGSLWLLFAFAGVYLFAALGIGLFLSTISSNQQQVMFMTFFFMLTFILMSGIFTPVESMPEWAQKINIINPYAYFMKVIRMILLKGSGFNAIRGEFLALGIFAAVMLSLSVWRYRKIN